MVRDALQESVRAHLVSDVPVGAFLSGGIDSAAVVSLMREAGAEDIHTFSIGSSDRLLDETSEARQAAAHFGTVHHETIITEADFRRMLPGFIVSLDQPTIDGFNTFVVSQFAHAHGMKVVVSGVGGDELFHGYGQQFRRLPRVAKWLERVPRAVRNFGASGLSAVMPAVSSRRAHRVVELLRAEPDLRSVHLWSRELFTPAEVWALCSDSTFGLEAATADLGRYVASPLPPPAGDEANLSAFEITRYLEPQLLKDSDRFSMAHSLELRTPLVDRVLLEQILALPCKYFHGPSRSVKPLLVSAAGLPSQLSERPKRGFALPFHAWLANCSPAQSAGGVLDMGAVARIHEGVRQNRRGWAASWALFVLGRYLADGQA
jgi:asparagine synthase (glutamine-hydrolysing)